MQLFGHAGPQRHATVAIIKNGDVVAEYNKLETIWENNSLDFIWEIAQIGRKHKTLVLSFCSEARSLIDRNMLLFSFKGGHSNRLVSIALKIKAMLGMGFKILTFEPKYIVTMDQFALPFLYLIARLTRSALIPFSVREDDLERTWFICLVRSRFITKILVCSKYLKTELIKHGVSKDKIAVVYPKYPNEFFTIREIYDYDATKYEYRLIFVGRLVRLKGIYELLEAMRVLIYEKKRSDIGLLYVGSGPEEAFLKNKAKEYKLDHNVLFVGYKDVLSVYSYLIKSDVLVLPHYTEGIGRVHLEGILSEIPMIITETGGFTDFVEHNKTCIFIRPKNVRDIVDAILRLYDSPNLRQSIRDNLVELKRIIREQQSVFYQVLMQYMNDQPNPGNQEENK